MFRIVMWLLLLPAAVSTAALPAIQVVRSTRGIGFPSIDVVTGPMKFSVQLTDDGYLSRVWIDEDKDGRFNMFEIVSNPTLPPSLFLKYVHLDDPSSFSPGMWWIDGQEIPLWGHADSIWVTESPGLATVHSRGRFGYDNCWPYELELTAEDGSTAIRAKFRFQFRGDPGRDFITSLGVRTGFDYYDQGTFIMRRFAFGAEDRVRQTSVLEAGWSDVGSRGRRRTTARQPRPQGNQMRSRGYVSGLSFIDSATIPIPEWNLASMIQFSPSYYRIWKAIEGDVGNLPVHFGAQCRGWVDVSDTTRGMAIALKDMGESFPKALSVDMGDWDPGASVTLELWPNQVPPLDLRPLTGDDYQVTSPAVRERLDSSGIERTYEWLIYFHPGDYRKGDVEKVVDFFQQAGQ
ncbi:hypothetical protein ACFLT7_00630 [candidate division KSB1 bacterium]